MVNITFRPFQTEADLKEFIHEAMLDLDESLRISRESSRQLEMLLKMLFYVLEHSPRN